MPEAEAAAGIVEPEDPADTRMTTFLVRCRDDAAARLAEAVKRAREAGVDDDFIESVRTRTEEGARFAWPFPSGAHTSTRFECRGHVQLPGHGGGDDQVCDVPAPSF